jgi:uncharacterized protein (TIGR02145 family)
MSLKRVLSLGFILLILLLGFTTIKPILASSSFIFNHNLSLGSINNDVKQLQIYLNNNGYILAKTGPGSKGKETTIFGKATKASLIKFQKANNIKPSVGYFGPITRDFINKKIKKQTIPTIPPINNNQSNNTNTNNNNNNQTNNTNNNTSNTTNNFHFGGGGLPSYTITYLAGEHGTITGTSTQTINSGASGTAVTATPDTGYYFVSWSDGVLTPERTDTNITSNLSLTATFAINSYTLTYTAGTHGTITGTTPQTINYGSDGVTVTATPDTGYYFVDWSDGILTPERTDLNITSNKSVTATFAINSYTITSSAGAHGTITSTDTVNYGSNKTFTITPDDGYLISDVLVDTVSVGTPATYTFTNVTTTHTISVTFAIAFTCGTSTISYGGQTYSTVSIGSQCWLGENLNIGTKVNSGISEEQNCHDVSGTGSGVWSCQVNNNAIEKYCYNNSDANCTTDGGLYEWAEALQLPYDCNNSTFVANEDGTYILTCPISGSKTISVTQQGICPTGWHIPSFNEYRTLAQVSDPGCDLDCDNGDCSCLTAGDKLKATASHTPIAWDGTDIYSFSALPSGGRNGVGDFYGRGVNAGLWSTVPNSDNPLSAWSVYLISGNPTIIGSGNDRVSGGSVRCVQDYTLTYTAGANGTITGSSPQSIDYGSSGTAVTAIPNTGYYFVNWSDGSTQNPRTDTNITGSVNVTANFEINTFTSCGDNVTYGGKAYPTVLIGSQCWFAKNLNIGTKVTSGSSEPNCHNISNYGFASWSCQVNNSTIEKYCYDNSDANCTTDGGLYEWAEAMNLPYDCNSAESTDNGNGTYILTCPISGSKTISVTQQGICPTGWHIPSFTEYRTLAQNADPGCDLDCDNGDCSCATAGGKLKATSSHTPIAWDGTDIYNFSALPSGYRDYDGSFSTRGTLAELWSTVPNIGGGNSLGAWGVNLYSGDAGIYGNSGWSANGLSVRCLKD